VERGLWNVERGSDRMCKVRNLDAELHKIKI